MKTGIQINFIPGRERGAVLVVSLLLLLIMTLLGVSSMQTTTLQERMAGNTRDRAVAMQSAEYGLRDAEEFIESIVTTGAFNGSNGLYGENDTDPDIADQTTWSTSDTTPAASSLAKTSAPPRYYIKLSGIIPGTQGAMNMSGYGENKGTGDVTTFKITSRGTGGSQETEVILRSHYGRAM